MAPEKELDTCRSHVRWETPRGRYDECSSKFSLRKETKVIEPVGLGQTPMHNTTKKLCPNVTVRLSISPACCKQRINCIVWKMIVTCKKMQKVMIAVDLYSDVKEWTGVHSSLVVSLHDK